MFFGGGLPIYIEDNNISQKRINGPLVFVKFLEMLVLAQGNDWISIAVWILFWILDIRDSLKLGCRASTETLLYSPGGRAEV